MARRWGKLGIPVALTCLAITGCTVQHGEQSSGSATNPTRPTATAQPSVPGGALAFGGGVGAACADGTGGGAFTFGVPITNRSEDAVQLVSAEFEHIGALELVGMWVVGPEVDDDDTGASTSWTAPYPPDDVDQPGWASRTAVGDTTISAHSSTWLAFAVQPLPGTTRGTVAVLSIDYEDSAGSWTVTDESTYGVGDSSSGALSCGA
ncbi:MAG TPA: hypothetical protein VGO65_12160 [Pseudolysinimonas sp.]|nr:hypothetical protein [Pseudolysinimonas sp.]